MQRIGCFLVCHQSENLLSDRNFEGVTPVDFLKKLLKYNGSEMPTEKAILLTDKSVEERKTFAFSIFILLRKVIGESPVIF